MVFDDFPQQTPSADEVGENVPSIQELAPAAQPVGDEHLDSHPGPMGPPLPPPASQYLAPVGLPSTFPASARVCVVPHLLPQPLSVGLAAELTTSSRTWHSHWNAQSTGLSILVLGEEVSSVVSHCNGNGIESHEQVTHSSLSSGFLTATWPLDIETPCLFDDKQLDFDGSKRCVFAVHRCVCDEMLHSDRATRGFC